VALEPRAASLALPGPGALAAFASAPAAAPVAQPELSSTATDALPGLSPGARGAVQPDPVPGSVVLPPGPPVTPASLSVPPPPLSLQQEDLGEAGRLLAAILDLNEVREALRGQGDGGARELITARKDQLKKAAEQLKAQHSIKIEQQMRAQEMLLDQEASLQRMRLHQVFHMRRAMLEQQAAALASEYSQRRMQEQFQRQQEDLQQEFLKQQEKETRRMAEQAAKLRASVAEVARLSAKAEAAQKVVAAIASSPSMVETLARGPFTARSGGPGKRRPVGLLDEEASHSSSSSRESSADG